MKIEQGKVGLVRGVVIVYEKYGAFEPVKAYTFWHRHDEQNLKETLEREINYLKDCYKRFDWSTMSCMLEWKNYRR